MSRILRGLNEAQHAAVTSASPVVQVLAPPGSGKTKTLASRVAYLLDHHGYEPPNVLCLTFTIKGANEMKERIAKLLSPDKARKLIVGTFHSVCLRYLRVYGHLIGIPRNFGITDPSDAEAILKRIIKRNALSEIDAKAAQSAISKKKACRISCDELSRSNPRGHFEKQLLQAYEAYESHLHTSHLLDFDDLLLRCIDLLQQKPHCVSNVQAVLVDEFQDTNVAQFDLMNLLASTHKRITTVGDPDQSIYGWRSAEVKNLTKMQGLYITEVLNLENNYRSSGAILRAAREVIEMDDTRPIKTVMATHCRGTVPTLRRAFSARSEAEWIASEIRRCICLTGNSLLGFSDFAILLRSMALSRQIESDLNTAGIPYQMVGGLKFFERAEIKILIDYLRVVGQPDNSDALARVLNVPPRRVGGKTMQALLEEASSKSITLWALVEDLVTRSMKPRTAISKIAQQGITTFYKLVSGMRRNLAEGDESFTPACLMEKVVREIGFKDYLEKSHPGEIESRWANVEELLALASAYRIETDADTDGNDEDGLPGIEGVEQSVATGAEGALYRFLSNVALSTERNNKGEKPDEDGEKEGSVTISTIHAAKGLEWPVVFIPAAHQGSIPHFMSEDDKEERRLLYVAMTRAKALLYISHSDTDTRGNLTTLSKFLSDVQVDSVFAKSSPIFNESVAQDISRILGRDPPSTESLEEGKCLVPDIGDDIWPGTLSSHKPGNQHSGKLDERASKRQRTGSERRGDEMANEAGAGPGGFVSANSFLREADGRETNKPKARKLEWKPGERQALRPIKDSTGNVNLNLDLNLNERTVKDKRALDISEERQNGPGCDTSTEIKQQSNCKDPPRAEGKPPSGPVDSGSTERSSTSKSTSTGTGTGTGTSHVNLDSGTGFNKPRRTIGIRRDPIGWRSKQGQFKVPSRTVD